MNNGRFAIFPSIYGRFWVVATLLSILSAASIATADQRYCGMYALAGAAKTLGLDPKISQLIDPAFISNRQGSTVADIRAAAEHLGLRATPLMGLSRLSLRAATDPMILHVTPRGLANSYNHWVLFLGIDNGQALIHDGPGEVVSMDLELLVSRWDGVALAVSKPQRSTGYIKLEVMQKAFFVLLMGLLIAIAQSGISRLPAGGRSSVAAVAVVLGVPLIFAIGWSSSDLAGSSARAARTRIDATMGIHSYPEVTIDHIARGDVLLIDARYSEDFVRGSIPGAGFDNLLIYRGGVLDWRNHHAS